MSQNRREGFLTHTVYGSKPGNTALGHWIVQCFMSPPTQYRLYGRREQHLAN